MLVFKSSRVVVKFIEDLPAKQFRQVWLKVLDLLATPYPTDTSKLQGYDYYRVDFSEYRIVYQVIEETTLELILIGKRNRSPAQVKN
ncbi:type II toxin-antitoxin system RelE family toxin [Thiolinea disciformis]|uniref:type II toxin-antitoxin system RelE family toxin n=1 Tax=Thiolinea disciformis TaxID=125614 RepID=UPI00036EFFA3|nr:type II toxin-antitoxin system RelE/ParE family toxin [Thiolinea disciformis]